jgi:hypothetical protein
VGRERLHLRGYERQSRCRPRVVLWVRAIGLVGSERIGEVSRCFTVAGWLSHYRCLVGLMRVRHVDPSLAGKLGRWRIGGNMDNTGRELVERQHREALAQIRAEGLGRLPESMDPVASLPDLAPGPPIAAEWDSFRKELEWLISQGNRGRIALVKTGHPITTWDTLRDALQAARLLYGNEPCLFQEIQPYLKPVRLGA